MTPRPKPLPPDPSLPLQRQLLLHPESNPTAYVPLQDALEFPFEPNATGWSRVNAWWLAEAAWLAYWHGKDDVRRVFREQAQMECQPVATDDTECYVAHNGVFAIITMRGTQPDRWADIFNDVCFVAEPWEIGQVHHGFARAFQVVQGALDTALGDIADGCPLWFTGHSLGAAVATLAAYHYRARTGGVYTFGSPLVGNGVFAGMFGSTFHERSVRYVNDHDVVTRVPPEPFALPHGLFTHVDHQRWISRDGHVGTTPPTIPHFVRDIFGHANALLDIINAQRQDISLQLPAALADHTPLYYVLHTWNDLAAHPS